MTPNGYEELVEKALPFTDFKEERQGILASREALREALSSGLLCDGQELKDAFEEIVEILSEVGNVDG